MKLQGKILLPILLLVILLMSAFGYFAYSNTRDSLTVSLIDNMEGEASSLTRYIGVLQETATRDVLRTAQRGDVELFVAGDIYDRQKQLELSSILKQVSDSYPDFDRMTIYDTRGIVVACSDKDVLGDDFSTREYIKKVNETRQLFLSAPFLSKVTQTSVIVIAAPIMQNGQLVAIITGNLSLAQFYKENVEPVVIGEDGYAFMLSGKGEVVIHKNPEWLFNSELPQLGEYKRLVDFKQGFTSYVNENGETSLAYVETDPVSKMVAVVTVEEADIFSSLNSLRNYTILVAAAGILLGFIVVFLTIRPVTRAIREGAAFAADIARGKLDGSLSVRRKDEIGELAESLKLVPKVLNDVIAEYTSLQDDVEHGKLDAQGNAGKFEGEYAKLVSGTNLVMNSYRQVIDNIPSPVVILSSEAKAVFLNTEAKKLAGDNYLNKTCGELFAREDYNTDQCALKRSLESKQPQHGETRAYPQGKEMEIGYSSIPMFDHSGKLSAILQLITDLTLIKQSQRLMIEVANEALDISNRVAAASEELSAQVSQVTTGADLQRERAASTATAMEEMNATVLAVAKSAADASTQASSTRDRAQSGAGLVEEVVRSINQVNAVAQELQQTMQLLTEQADSIGGVMNVISDIADQTNLLALNAAIEAARAGDAGRGFAVVADEVRKLAEKTMTATSEVSASIKNIQDSTRVSTHKFSEAAEIIVRSTELAGNSGEALQEIMALVNNNSELVTEIATAAEEQSATSDEINKSVEEINHIADETAHGMEQSSMAVNELANMSQELKNLLGRLRN